MNDTIYCPNCGLGFAVASDYAEHMRCYVSVSTPESDSTKFKFNSDPEWMRKKAELEDGCIVSVGGLIHDLEQPTPESDSTASTTHGNPKSDKLTSCQTDLD